MAADARPLTAARFSIAWKIFFHGVEKFGRIFHAMENFFADFPRNGKVFSAAWKTEGSGPWAR